MGGVYPNFFVALQSILRKEGIAGFYVGWFPALVQKIPSYALTWMFFQQIKAAFLQIMHRVGNTIENTLFGAFAVKIPFIFFFSSLFFPLFALFPVLLTSLLYRRLLWRVAS